MGAQKDTTILEEFHAAVLHGVSLPCRGRLVALPASAFPVREHNVVLRAIFFGQIREESGHPGGYTQKRPSHIVNVCYERKGAAAGSRETIEDKEQHNHAASRKVKVSQECSYAFHCCRAML
jgi:hypothetical protein